mgnify:CR=1
TPKPNKPIAATVKPIIDPPKKATVKLSDIPNLFAEFVVLTFALVDVYMPINPVADEQSAPITNANVLSAPSPTKTPTVSKSEKTNRIEYSFLMKENGGIYDDLILTKLKD